MANAKELIGQMRLAERTVKLCLRWDLVAEIERLEDERDNTPAPPEGDQRLGQVDPRKELNDQIDALREQMRDATVTFRMRALNRRDWDALVKAHPPRQDKPADMQLGFNTDGFFDALIRTCTVDPGLTNEEWETLFDSASSKQYDDLMACALAINRADPNIPFWSAVSQILNSARR